MGGGGVLSCDTQQHLGLLLFIYLFMRNIPKRINYIMKYLDSHFYRFIVGSIVGDSQSNLII